MGRLIVMWTDPMHLSPQEAEVWVREQTARLRAIEGIRRLELARVDRAADAHAGEWDWLLELSLRPGAQCAGEPLFLEWMSDLRLLGMRPVTVHVGDGTAMPRDAA